MGGDPDDADSVPPDPWDVWVVRRGEHAPLMGPVVIRLEHGGERHADGVLPADLPLGYHDLHPLADGRPREQPTRLIVSPGIAAPPPDRPAWGLAVQLYAARSEASWGVGDLADLRELGALAHRLGARTLLVNPLDAATPTTPRDASPYYPSSRRFREPLYLAIEDVPGIATTPGVALLAAEARALNAQRTIDRDEVGRLKHRALELLWEARAGRDDEPGFGAYRSEQGPSLASFATFCALAESLGGGWRSWPPEYRDASSRAVTRFSREHEDRVRFHAWVQWLLDEQLRRAGDAIGVLRDLPVGFDPDGADAWAWRELLALDVSIGAPPDQLGPEGQSWRLPPFVPWRLQAAAYAPIVHTLRSAFRHAAGLRIDHVLGLFRQFWVPPGGSPADGTYVTMPTRELLDIVALESHRARAFVVGEDLGTVPEGVREELRARGMLRYQVMLFEEGDPEAWEELALASATTHDLPTLAGLWTGADAAELRALGRQPNDGWQQAVRTRLRADAHATASSSGADAVLAGHRLLSRARARLVVAQLDDVLGVEQRPNVPGTTGEERANWSLALPVALEHLPDHEGVRATADAFAPRA
jgi:4-alpha-glucanotransferase